MKVITNSLKPVIGVWEDPGDYPSGAGGGPLPNQEFVEYIDGVVEVELEEADEQSINDYADIDMTYTKMVEAWLKKEPTAIDPDIPGLRVKSWCLEHYSGQHLTLSVDDFDASDVSLPERDYDDLDD